jgi:hypothetical protein
MIDEQEAVAVAEAPVPDAEVVAVAEEAAQAAQPLTPEEEAMMQLEAAIAAQAERLKAVAQAMWSARERRALAIDTVEGRLHAWGIPRTRVTHWTATTFTDAARSLVTLLPLDNYSPEGLLRLARRYEAAADEKLASIRQRIVQMPRDGWVNSSATIIRILADSGFAPVGTITRLSVDWGRTSVVIRIPGESADELNSTRLGDRLKGMFEREFGGTVQNWNQPYMEARVISELD